MVNNNHSRPGIKRGKQQSFETWDKKKKGFNHSRSGIKKKKGFLIGSAPRRVEAEKKKKKQTHHAEVVERAAGSVQIRDHVCTRSTTAQHSGRNISPIKMTVRSPIKMTSAVCDPR